MKTPIPQAGVIKHNRHSGNFSSKQSKVTIQWATTIYHAFLGPHASVGCTSIYRRELLQKPVRLSGTALNIARP